MRLQGSGQITPLVHCQKLSTFTKESVPCEWQIDLGCFRGRARLSHITQRPLVHEHD